MEQQGRPKKHYGWGLAGLAEDRNALRLAFSQLEEQWASYLDLRHLIPKESIPVTTRGRERILIALDSLVRDQVLEQTDGRLEANKRGKVIQQHLWRTYSPRREGA